MIEKNTISILVFILYTLLNCSCSNISNRENNAGKYLFLNYRILAKDTLKYKHLKDENWICKNEDIGYIMKKYNTKYNIKIINYNHLSYQTEKMKRDTLIIFNTKYLLDSLFYVDNYQNHRPISADILSSYFIEFSEKEYIVLFIKDWKKSCIYCEYLGLLFDITNKSNVQCINLGLSSCEDINCLGDFDSDAKLDFVYISYSDIENSGSVYSLMQNNVFKKRNDNWLNIKVSSDLEFIIDLKTSKWFFDLEKMSDKIVYFETDSLDN
jgi:hypothetical protein